jgi:hypothetical protein
VVAVIGLAPQVFTGPERAHRPAPSPIAPGVTVSPQPRQPTPSRPYQRPPRAPHPTAMPTTGRPEQTATPAVRATPRGRPLPSRSRATTGRTEPIAGYRPPAPPRTFPTNATTSP